MSFPTSRTMSSTTAMSSGDAMSYGTSEPTTPNLGYSVGDTTLMSDGEMLPEHRRRSERGDYGDAGFETGPRSFYTEGPMSMQPMSLSREEDGSGPPEVTARAKTPVDKSPLNAIVSFLITAPSGTRVPDLSIGIGWVDNYEEDYGDLAEFVATYQTLFTLSPTTDQIVLKMYQERPTNKPVKGSSSGPTLSQANYAGVSRDSFRRPGRPGALPPMYRGLRHLGSVGYSSVGEALDVELLDTVYRRRGMQTRVIAKEVVQVSDRNDFTLFAFDNGAIVWWGNDRADHWIVENDFYKMSSEAIRAAIKEPHYPHEIDALFPVWCSFTLKKYGAAANQTDNIAAKFEKDLAVDHFAIPADEEDSIEDFKLAISNALADAAKLDYYEHTLALMAKQANNLREVPQSVPLLYSSKPGRKHQGELALNRVLLQDIDESVFLWEHPWLKSFRDMTREQFSILQRLEYCDARFEAMTESLTLQDSTQHRLFMIKSEWILIAILAADMLLMLFRLIVTLYFVEPTKDNAVM